MIKIYHNPRCTKSRQGLALLEAAKVSFETIKYLDTPVTKAELEAIIDKLNITPIQLVRKNEAIWKEQFKGKELSDDTIIAAMLEFPKLMERPIVVNGNKAVIGRPTENIAEII